MLGERYETVESFVPKNMYVVAGQAFSQELSGTLLENAGRAHCGNAGRVLGFACSPMFSQAVAFTCWDNATEKGENVVPKNMYAKADQAFPQELTGTLLENAGRTRYGNACRA